MSPHYVTQTMNDARSRNPLLTGGNNPGGSDFGGRGGHPGWRNTFSPGMLPPLFSQRGYSNAQISIDARSQRAQTPRDCSEAMMVFGGRNFSPQQEGGGMRYGQQTMLSISQAQERSENHQRSSGSSGMRYGQQTLLSTSQA